MCASATHWAQLGKIVFGAKDPKAGYRRIIQDVLHPKTRVRSGILEKECSALLSEFFRDKR
jgi:tRNA(adenine34) deaminase